MSVRWTAAATWAALLGLLTLLSRLPFLTRTLYSFDSANYVFALRDYYNVGHHHPHPPGYPLYVAFAKLIDLALRDPNLSLVLLSAIASAAAVAATMLLGAALYGTRLGVVSGLLLACTVGFWGYSEVAYPYTSLAFWVVCGALVCHRVLQGHVKLIAPLGLLLGIAAGFRWDAAFFLGPLWLWALTRVGWRGWLASIGAFVLACVAWAVPMIWLSGGPTAYLEALRLQSEYIVGTYSLLSGGRAILEFNLAYLVTFFRQMYGLSLILVLYSVGRILTPGRLATDFRTRFLLVWMAPALLVYFTVHIGEPGYLLSLAPTLALLGALALVELDAELRLAARVLAARWPLVRRGNLGDRLARVAMPLALVLLLAYQTNAFVTSIGPARLPELRLIDLTQQAQLAYARQGSTSNATIVLAHDRFRQTEYELSGYRVVLLFDEYAQGWREGRTWTLDVPVGAERLIVFDELDPAQGGVEARGREIVLREEPRVTVWEFDLRGVRTVAHGYRRVELQP